jgi:predicted metalloendopeptidase
MKLLTLALLLPLAATAAIIHRFDDRGRQYDADGNLVDWWAPEGAAACQARAERVVELYGRYQPLPGLRIDGRTPEQRFFVANAVIWRNQQRAQALEQQIRTGSHSPGRYRVLGPMSQMPAFAQAFGCQPGDPMVAADPVAMW